jgi:hypothetical protein
MILQQELHGEDFQKRTEFCNFIQRQNGVYSHILFSDEATFRSDSIVNRHNMHYWSIDNPHWVRHVDYQVRWSINVWGGIIGEHVLGPHFFEGYLNGPMYLEFLGNECTDLIGGSGVPPGAQWAEIPKTWSRRLFAGYSRCE